MVLAFVMGLISGGISIPLFLTFFPGTIFALAGLIILRSSGTQQPSVILGWTVRVLIWIGLSTVVYWAAFNIASLGYEWCYPRECESNFAIYAPVGGVVGGLAVCLGYCLLMWRKDFRTFFGVLLGAVLGWSLFGGFISLFLIWQVSMLCWLKYRYEAFEG